MIKINQKMKYKTMIILMVFLSAGCSRNNEKSDGYGIFETDAVIVASEVQGKVLQLTVERGKHSEAGSVAALIDTMQIRLKLDQVEAQKKAVMAGRKSVEAQIAVYQEQKKNILNNLKRLEAMFAEGAATQKQLDDLNGEMNVADRQIASIKTRFIQINSELEVLEAQRAATIDQLKRCTVSSPVSGVVLETYIETGELATPGKALYKLAPLDELTLKVYVSGAQLPQLKIGQEVQVLVDKSETENQSFGGTITWISPQAEFTPKIIQTKEERVKLVYAVKVAVKNDGTLKIGMPGEIRL
jgi:HlyD family secretion protein